jgi:hypothetical protein
MSEFNNRITAQREILRLVNARPWQKEELFSLSSKAIERWVMVNRLDSDCRLLQLIRSASEKLFFLANRSQEQISDEYKSISNGFSLVAEAIREEMTSPSFRVT